MERAADSGPYDPSLIPLGEKKENKQKRGRGWPIKNNVYQSGLVKDTLVKTSKIV